MRLRMWQTEQSLEDVFLQLAADGMEQPVLKEIGKRRLFQRSLQDYNLHTVEVDQEKRLHDFCAALKLNTPEQFTQWLTQNRLTREGLLQQLTTQERLDRLKRAVIAESAIQEAFIQKKGKLDTVVFSLIRVEDENMAWELYHRLQDDHEDFSDLAKQFSVGAEGPMGGLVGPKPFFELNPELRKKLVTLKPGEITPPFTLDAKQHLVLRMVQFHATQLTPALENEIRNELFDQWTERQLALAELQLIHASDRAVSERSA